MSTTPQKQLKPTANPFAAIGKNLASKSKTISIVNQTPDENGGKIPTPTEANSVTIEVFPLSAKHAQQLADMRNSVIAPLKSVKRPSPLDPSKTIEDAEHDFDDPTYLADLETMDSRCNLAIILMSCPSMLENTPGSSLDEKIDALAEAIPANVAASIIEQVQDINYSIGPSADFFTNAASANSKSSRGGASSRTPKRKSVKS